MRAQAALASTPLLARAACCNIARSSTREYAANMIIACLGDSLTYGYGIPRPKVWTTLLARRTGIDVRNCGINGDTTGGMLARFHPQVVQAGADAVLIMGGFNDLALGTGLGVECQHVVHPPSLEAGGFLPRAECGRKKLYRCVHIGRYAVLFQEWVYVSAYAHSCIAVLMKRSALPLVCGR